MESLKITRGPQSLAQIAPEPSTSRGLGPYLTSPLSRASSAIILREVRASSLTRLRESRACQGTALVPGPGDARGALPRLLRSPLVSDDLGQSLQRSHICCQTYVHFLGWAIISVLVPHTVPHCETAVPMKPPIYCRASFHSHLRDCPSPLPLHLIAIHVLSPR